ILRPLRVGSLPTVETEFKNFGKLAAEAFGVGGLVEIRKNEPPWVNSVGGKNLGELPPGFPTKPYVFRSTSVLTTEQLNAINTGALKVYAFGDIQFDNPL